MAAQAEQIQDSVPAAEPKKVLETKLSDFFAASGAKSPLSDVQLHNKDTGALHQCHKAIVASGSQYMLEVFMGILKKEEPEEINVAPAGEAEKKVPNPQKINSEKFEDVKADVDPRGPYIDIPQPVKTQKCDGKSTDENINRILKYIYNNQDFSVIKGELTEEILPALYSQAYVLKCTELMKDLDTMIENEILNPHNACMFYLESIYFQTKKISDAAELIIQQNFDEIIQDEMGWNFIISLPAKYFTSLLSSNALNISDEHSLIGLFEKYLDHRKDLPDFPENDPALKYYEMATPEEKKRIDDENAKKQEEEKKAKEEEEKKLEEEVKKMPEYGQYNHHWDVAVTKKVQAECAARVQMVRLRPQEIKDLFKSARYSYMSHDQLILLSQNPVFNLAKDYILEGLSFRLNNFENAIKKETAINVQPRSNAVLVNDQAYSAMPKTAATTTGAKAVTGLASMFAAKKPASAHTVQNLYSTIQPGEPAVNKSSNVYQGINTTAGQRAYGLSPTRAAPLGSKHHPNPYLRKGQYENYYERRLDEENQMHAGLEQNLIKKLMAKGIYDQMSKSKLKRNFTDKDLKEMTVQEKQALLHGMTLAEQKGEKWDQYAFEGTKGTKVGPIPPMKPTENKKDNSLQERPYEFVFKQHFDEGGALYFLGSYGGKRLYQNPHTIGQVQAFASSIGSGLAEDIVGREIKNTRTGNEPFSYVGVDLGEQRQLLPTCYSLRNRGTTSTHTMLNWHFEGSNDKVNWTTLDRRLYLTGDAAADQACENERQMLCQKAAATTWGVDTDIYREIGFDGFRYFRVIQVGTNSSGSNNLALSGLEIYGRVISGRWP